MPGRKAPAARAYWNPVKPLVREKAMLWSPVVRQFRFRHAVVRDTDGKPDARRKCYTAVPIFP